MKKTFILRSLWFSWLLILATYLAPQLMAQGLTVHGTIVDTKDEPIVGASVVLKKTPSKGVTTDVNGAFTLSGVQKDAILRISCIGYETREVSVAGQTQLKITLKEDAQLLGDVVVVGYGTQKKVNLSGSVTALDPKQIQARPIQNLSNGLQGLVPGLTITATNGAPGLDGGKLRIRGTGTLNNADPYILIDGLESGTLNMLDPSDIESLSVLKDAASAAIYGSKAANGVILITTKRGKSGKARVSYSGSVGMQNATRLMERMDSYEYASLYNKVMQAAGKAPRFSDDDLKKFKDGSDPEGHPNTDWYRLAFRTALMQHHNVNVSGGTEQVRYMASIGYLGQTGILPNAKRNQFNARTNLDLNLSRLIKARLGLSYIKNKYSDPNNAYVSGGSDQIIRQLNIISPWVLGRSKDGKSWGTTGDGNPLAWLDSGQTIDRDNHNISATGGLDFHVLEGLTLTANVAYVASLQHYKAFVPFIKYNDHKVTAPNNLDERYYLWTRANFDALANYTKSFGKNNFKALLGWHAEDFHTQFIQGKRKNFPSNDLTDLSAGSSSTQQNEGTTAQLRMLSWFGRLNYDFDGKYLLEANFRADASSRFAEGYRWGYFPSFSAAWRLSKEEFMQPLFPVLSDLKLRASWGLLGNQEALNDYYPALNTYNIGATYPFGGSLTPGYAQTDLKLNYISWEKSRNVGVGLDFGFLSGQLTGSIDLYARKTTDILMKVDVPAEFPLRPYYANVGSMENKGVEVALNYQTTFGDWTLGVGGNFTYNKNKILSLGANKYMNGTAGTRNAVGHPFETYYLYKADGLFQSKEEADQFVAKYGTPFGSRPQAGDIRYVDVNGDGKIDGNDRVYTNPVEPAYTFALNFNLGWRSFDFSAMFSGVAAASRLYSSEVFGSFAGDTGHPSTEWRKAWSPENPSGKMPRAYLSGHATHNEVSSTFWLQNTHYLRLKNLQLGYTLPKSLLATLGVSSVRVYYSAENLFTLDNMRGNIDPEATSQRLSSYPLLRTHSLGLNVSF